MPSRRARPTLRVLREDLKDGWEDPYPRRRLDAGDLASLHPLSELPHPIIAKAAEAFGEEAGQDNYVGRIGSCTSIYLCEIKSAQWRGGVWIADDGVCWLIVAGIAKGDHEDWDDFYQRVKRADSDIAALLPTKDDERLLKQEVAHRHLANWDLTVQAHVAAALERVHAGGATSFDVVHPLPHKLDDRDRHLARVHLTIEPHRERGYRSDDVVVEVEAAPRWAGSNLVWQLTTRVLISLEPPEQGWDRFENSFSNIAEPGTFTTRRDELIRLASEGLLAESMPGQHAHQTHKDGLTERTAHGRAVRALCGAFFVPRQDHESLPECETCRARVGLVGEGSHG